jgi:Putative homoserine kinase type II (protein kinase fold)
MKKCGIVWNQFPCIYFSIIATAFSITDEVINGQINKKEVVKVDLFAQIKLHYGNDFHKLNMVRDWIGQVYEVTNGNTQYIAKVFRKEYTSQALQSVEVMTYLKDKNFPVPGIITTLNGTRYFVYNNQIVVLYEYINGECVDIDRNLFNLGKQSGLMRKSMESYVGEVANHGYDYFINRYLDIMEKKAYHGIHKFSELGNYLWENIKNLPHGFIHGDLHNGNMFQTKNEIVFFDFDACAIASPVYDIATTCDATDYFDLSAENFENGYIQTQRNVTEFLKGYEMYFNLSKEEESAIYDFIAIRHFDIQATIIESRGLACVDEQFLDEQYLWLDKWINAY